MAHPPRTNLAPIADAFADFDEAQAADLERTLLQMAADDPPMGAPRQVQVYPGGELEPIEPGAWREAGFVWGGTQLPRDCPAIPLGKDGETAYLLDTMGAVAELKASASGKGPIGAIFAGRSAYLEWAWPRWGTKGVAGWDADNCRQALFDACAYVGFFSLEDHVRGRGAWRHEDGSLIFHAGKRVWFEGRWRSPGQHGAFIYPGRPEIEAWSRRGQPAGEDGPGVMTLDLLRSFNWDRGELDARLMLGWTMTAKVGGALETRPVVYLTGTEGGGKTTLHKVLRPLMGRAVVKTSDTTQAGIYHNLKQDSVAIMVDEMGDRGDMRTAGKILELARICYSGDRLNRGSQSGEGKSFALNSSFMGSSIARPATTSQDDSRMAVVMLREREKAGGKLTISEPELLGIGRGLLRRWIDWWERWPALQDVFRAALIDAGQDDRACDTFVPLAAACHVALSDEMPCETDLAEWKAWLAVDALEETANREKTWRKCLTYLLDAQAEPLRAKEFSWKSVGAVLNAFAMRRGSEIGGANEMDIDRVLAQCGLAFSWPDDELRHDYDNGRLFVPAKHPALNGLFAGSAWEGRLGDNGPWIGVLRQMPRELFTPGKCGKGLDRKASGIFIDLAKALAA